MQVQISLHSQKCSTGVAEMYHIIGIPAYRYQEEYQYGRYTNF